MAANSYKSDITVRIHFPGHGITIQEQKFKIVTHSDGTQVGVTREEWQKMIPPLLVKLPGQSWTFGGLEVELKVSKGRGH